MSTPPTFNTRYYWDFVVFKVENELFKVPKYGFASNPYPPFNELFSLPQEGSGDKAGEPEGSSPENPIVLEQILRVDFERFLGVLYPHFQPPLSDDPNSNRVPETVQEAIVRWRSVLKLSTLWNFVHIRKTAINNLSGENLSTSFSAVDLILAGREYGVLHWFIEGVISIACAHTSEINREDAHKIVLDTALSLYYLKGDMRRIIQNYGSLSYNKDQQRSVLNVLGAGIGRHLKDDISDVTSKARANDHISNVTGISRNITVSIPSSYGSWKCVWSISYDHPTEGKETKEKESDIAFSIRLA